MAEPIKSRQIGKYQIQAELGRGGFGSVYRAYDPTVGRLVAIKVLTAAGDQNLLSRFKNEAAAAGNLRHKNIITIYDFGDHEGLPYIVMEFLDGEDLQHVISRSKQLTLLEKVSIMLQVADGLHCAHRSGVVHRDVKPGNIRLLPDGTVKIMDFGIARLVAEGSGGTRLTRQGHVIGTLLYMAPEQLRGSEVDFLCDIFAYGITYYELLAGKHPFHGSDPRAVFYRITSEDPEPIRNVVPECPEALEAILHRTLHKERELRYQSLREVQLDTEPILIELRQERATMLLSEAARLYSGGQLDSAQAVLSEVFDLDPGNRDARQLRETIQSKLLRRVIEPKVEALLKKADSQIAERQFLEAIGSCEAALRLDRGNAEVKQQLDRARELLNISRDSARGVADAKREFSRNNLEGALETLPQVLELDPGNPDARQLFQDVRQELERRERERLYEKKLQQVMALLQTNHFDEALDELNSLEGNDAREDAIKLAAQIKEKKQAHERHQKIREELGAARDLLVTDQYEAAIPRLERLMNKYPEEPEATKLFIAAHKKLAAQRKGEALENLGIELSSLIEGRQFDRAREVVNAALREYPAEQRLLDATRHIDARQEQFLREEAIQEALEKALAHVAQEAPGYAVQVLEEAIALHPGEERLAAELSGARALLAQQQRDQAIDALCWETDARLERREFESALSAVDEGLEAHGQDPRLDAARKKIVEANCQWERHQAVCAALEVSAQSLAGNDPDSAVAILVAASNRYPDDSQLTGALAHARKSADEKRRADAIEQVCREADVCLQDWKFDQATAVVDEALATFAGEERLTRLRDQIVSARVDWERTETIRLALEHSRRSLSNDDPLSAVKALDAALEQYPQDDELARAADQARQALFQKQREQAIQSALQQAGSDSGNRQFDRALTAIDQAIDAHGADQRLSGLRDRIVQAKSDWEREEDILKTLHDADAQLRGGDTESALNVLEAALERYPYEQRLSQALAVTHRTLESARLEASIQALCRDLSALLERGEFDRALESLENGVQSLGDDDRLNAFRGTIVAAKDEWIRAETVRDAFEQSSRHLLEGDPEAALQILEPALARYQGEPGLETALAAARQALEFKRRESAIETALDEAGSQLEHGEFDRAFAGLDQAIEANGPDQRLKALRERVAAKATLAREETIRQAVAESNRRLALGDPEGALQAAEAALADYPNDATLLVVAGSAREALETTRRNVAIEDACRDAALKTECQEFDAAQDRIAQAIANYGADQRLTEMQLKTATAKADWQRQSDIRAVLQDCEQSIAKGDLEAALRVLGEALREFGDDSQLAAAISAAQDALEARNHAAAIKKTTGRVRRLLKTQQFERALLAVEQGLDTYTGDSRLAQLRDQVVAATEDWNREQNVRQALSRAAELQAMNRGADALEELRQALAKYPGETRLATAYREIEGDFQREQREESLDATVSHVRHVLAPAPEEAGELLKAASAEQSDDPCLAAAPENAQQLSPIGQRGKTIDAVCLETRRFLEYGQFNSARNTVEEGLLAHGDEPRLVEMRETVQASTADFERAEGIRQAVEDAGRYAVQGQLETALQSLLTATKVFGPVDRLTEAVTATKTAIEKKQRQAEIERFCRQAHAEIDAQRLDNARQLLNEGEQLHGPAPEFDAIRQRVDSSRAEQHRVEAINHAIREIEELMAQRALDQAVRAADAALAKFAGEPRLSAIRSNAIRARDSKRKDEAIERICGEIRTILNRKDFKAALKKIKQGQQTYGADPRFDQLRAEVAASKTASEPRNKPASDSTMTAVSEPGSAADTSSVLPASRSRRNPKLLRIAVEIAVIVAAVVALWLSGYGRPSKTVRLQIKVSPANASVRVNNQTCTNGDCGFDLKPGVYRVQISAAGYQSRTEDARLALGSKSPSIAVTLKPLSPTVRVAANIVQGQVSIDGKTTGRLLDGQFTLDSLQPGHHELRVSGSDYTARIAFQSEFARIPVLGSISADGVDVIALGGFGNDAAVSCPKCSGTLVVDDLPAREIKNGLSTIASLTAGTHRLRLTGESGERSVVFAAGEAPAIHLVLTSNRNYGTLVVETGEDGVSVFIDGQRNTRTTARGQMSMPVEAKEHTVRVAKDGFRADPPEFRATVTKGSQLQARFRLIPLLARLLVTSGAPGARISIDGNAVGSVAPDGSFSTQVPPGKHRIQFAHEGFGASEILRDFSPGRAIQLSRADVHLTPLPQSTAPSNAQPRTAPVEPPRPDLASAELADWQRVARNPSVADIEEFLQKHPGGANAPEAQRLLERLEWNGTNRNSKAALQQFLSRFGEGSHAQEARSLLAGIEKVEAEALAALQGAKEQETRTENDLQAVSRTLRAFEDAYNRRDLAELQRLWNPMPSNFVESYRNQFREAKALAFRIRPTGTPSLNGDTATAICTRTLSFTARSGARPPETNERVRVTLDRNGSTWAIRTITPF
jgi:eukaryotic-like serine/threonine-protein kinase